MLALSASWVGARLPASLLNFMPDAEKAASEMARVVKPGGAVASEALSRGKVHRLRPADQAR